jgi:hypothetical protein
MNLLTQARSYILLTFFLSLSVFVFGIYIDTKPITQTSNIIAHAALFLLMLSELFGKLSNEGSASARLVTWIAIVISGVVIISLI